MYLCPSLVYLCVDPYVKTIFETVFETVLDEDSQLMRQGFLGGFQIRGESLIYNYNEKPSLM